MGVVAVSGTIIALENVGSVPNMLATPHIGASAEEIRLRSLECAIAGLTSHEPVDPATYYAD